MEKAAVKSLQEMGIFALRPKSSRMSMRNVKVKQKHQLNMHQTQKDAVVVPTEATKLKVMQVTMTSSIRTMPIGTVRVFRSNLTMMKVFSCDPASVAALCSKDCLTVTDTETNCTFGPHPP